MDGLVNDTHKSALSTRNSEPTHLDGGSYDDIGGKGVTDDANTVKVDAARGVKTDTSVKGAGALSEPSHLKTEDEDDELDVKFDEEDDVDDIDAQLDAFESVDPVDVDVKVDESDDDDEDDKVNESDDDDEDDKKVNEDDDEDKKDDKVNEDFPWQKKGDDDKEEDDDKKKVDESDDDEDDKKKVEESDDDDEDDKKVNEDDDEDKDDKKVEESLKLRIKLPKANLFESVVPKGQQKKVATIYEAAIKDVTKQISEQVSKHYKKLHETKLAKRDAIMAKQVDGYLNYVVEQWVKTNRVSIRKSLRSQLAEEFLNGLQKLFKEHYIDVPESKVDVVKQLTAQVSKLQKSLNEQVSQKLQLRKLAEAANKARIVADFAMKNKLSEAQTSKLMKLTEDVSYTKAAAFREKLSLLKETYLVEGKKTGKKVLPEEKVPTEKELMTEDKKVAKSDDADVNYISEVLSRQAKQGLK